MTRYQVEEPQKKMNLSQNLPKNGEKNYDETLWVTNLSAIY